MYCVRVEECEQTQGYSRSSAGGSGDISNTMVIMHKPVVVCQADILTLSTARMCYTASVIISVPSYQYSYRADMKSH